MNNFQSLLQSVRQVESREQCAYVMGYVTAEAMHDSITKAEYDILFNLLKRKRSVLNA